jgi:hypothetical protein
LANLDFEANARIGRIKFSLWKEMLLPWKESLRLQFEWIMGKHVLHEGLDTYASFRLFIQRKFSEFPVSKTEGENDKNDRVMYVGGGITGIFIGASLSYHRISNWQRFSFIVFM